MGNFFLVEGSNVISLKFDLDIIVSSMGNFFLVEGSNAISLIVMNIFHVCQDTTLYAMLHFTEHSSHAAAAAALP